MKKKIYLNTLKDEEVIKRLKNGEVIHIEKNSYKIKMIDGMIVEKLEDCTVFGISFTVDSTNDFYFEEEEPFEITQLGFYKTRDGRKAYISYIDKNIVDRENVFGIIEGEPSPRRWFKYGRYDTNEKTKYDIIDKWED